MAKGINIPVHGDTRPLQREIARATKRPIKLGGLDDRAFRQPLGRIKGQMGEFQKSLEASNARVIAFGASAGAIMAIQYAFKSLVTTVVTVEKKLAEVNVILGTNQKNLNRFGSELFSIAKKTEQSFDSVATAATELARQGLGLELTLRRTKDAMILTRLAGTSVVDSVESITAALNGFNKAALNSTKVINKIIAVDQAFAVSGKDLAEALKRVGSTAQDAGVSLDQLMAVVTTAQQITARGGAVIGNSFKTIFTRIQRPKVIEALQAVGVATKDLTGNSLSAIKVLQNLAAQFDRLSQSQRSQVAELVGGVFQINVLKAALSDLGKSYSIYDRALKTSLSSADEAQRRNALLNKTLAASANELVVNLQKVGASVGKLSIEPVLRRVLGGVNKALNTLDVGESSSVGSKIGEGIFKGIGSFLKGPGLALAVLGIFKLFEKLRVFASDAFKTMTGLNQTQTRQAEIQKNISQYLQNNPKLLSQIKRGTLSIEQVHEKILIKIKQETKEMQDQARIAGKISGALYSRGVRTKGQDAGSDEGRLHVKSQGHIPNFSKTDQIASAVEIASASYAKPSTKVIKSKQPGLGTYYRNSEETITRVPGYKQHFVNPPSNSSEGRKHKVNSIKKTGINPYSSSGKIPNFAKTGVYDSDLIAGGGMSKQAKQVLSTIISSGKRVNSVWGPSGSGKTTWAKGKFGGIPITDPKQVGDYQDFVVLYGGNQSRKGGLTAQGQQVMGASARSGGQIFALVPKGGNMEIKNRRENRAGTGSGDLRTDSQIKDTKRAPLWDYGFLSQAKKQYPNLQVVRNQEGHVPSFSRKAQRLLHLTPESLPEKGATITHGGYTMSKGGDVKGYLAIKGMNSDLMSKLLTQKGFSSDGPDVGPGYLKTIKNSLNSQGAVTTPINRKELLSLASGTKFGISAAPSSIFPQDPSGRAGSSEEHRIKTQLFTGSNTELFKNMPVPVGTYQKTDKGKTLNRTKWGASGVDEEFPQQRDISTGTQVVELSRMMRGVASGRVPLKDVIPDFERFAGASDPEVLKLRKGLGFEDFINLTKNIGTSLTRNSDVLDFKPYELAGLPATTKKVLGLNPLTGYGDAKLNTNDGNAIGLAQKWLRQRAGSSENQHLTDWLRKIIDNGTTITSSLRGDEADEQLSLLHSGTANGNDSVKLSLSKLAHGAGGTDFKNKFSGLFEQGTDSKGQKSKVTPDKYKGKSFNFNYLNDAIDIPEDIDQYLDALTVAQPMAITSMKPAYLAAMKKMVGENTAAKTKSQGFTPNFVDPYDAADLAGRAVIGGSMMYSFLRSTMGGSFNPLGVKGSKGKAPTRMDKLVDGTFDVATTDLGNLGSIPNKIQRMLAVTLPNSKKTKANGFVPNFVDPYDAADLAGRAVMAGSMMYSMSRSILGDKFNPLGIKGSKGKAPTRMDKLVEGAFDVAQTDLGNLDHLPNKIQRMLAIALPNSKIRSPKLSESEIKHRQKDRYMAQGFTPNFVDPYDAADLAGRAVIGGSMMYSFLRSTMGGSFNPLGVKGSKGKAPTRMDKLVDGTFDVATTDLGNLGSIPNKIQRMLAVTLPNSKKTKANGFVPNFASGLEGAIKREHSAGIPMKDIRVGTDPALKTSSNPQGTGVWNVAQENSLQQGMSFAKQAGINPKTKGAFGGHVPNFEMEGGAKFYEFGTKNMSEDQLKSQEKFQDSVFKASFAFGTLTSVIGQFAGDAASTQAATSKLTDGLTNAGTAVQLIPGPAGKLAGGVVLAAGAISAIASATQSVGDDIVKENARLKGVTQSASDNLAKYGESFSSYVEEIAKGSTDTRRINDLQKKMLASLGEIPAQYRSQLMSSRNLTDVQEKIAKAQSEMSKRSMQVNTGATVATEMDKQLGMGDVFGRNVGLDDDVFKGGKGGALLGQFNIDLVRTLDMEGLSKHADQLGAAFSFSSMKSQDFINSLRTQHGLTGEVAGIMEEMSDAEIKKVASALEESVRQNARARREFEALNVVLKDNARATNAIKEATQRSTAALRTFITSGLESLKSSRGRSFQSGADKRGLMLERAKGGVSLAEGVLTKDLKLALDTQIKTLERQEKYYASSEKIMDEGRTKLAEAIRKITEIQPKSKGGSGQMAGKELSPEMAGLQRGLMGILKQTENSGLAETRKAFDDFVKSNKQAFAGKNYESESIAILKSQASKLLELKAEQVQANRIAEIQTTVQKKLLQAQRDSATGGGIEKFLEGSKKSFDDRVKFVEKLSKFAGFAEAGLDKETSRSGLNLNKEIRDFLGGLNVNDPALRGMAIKGRSQDIRDESGFRIKQIMSLIPRMIAQGRPDAAASLRTQALALQGVRNRSGAIATRQVDEEVKTRSLPTEIANLVSEIKVLNREQASLDTKLGSSLQQAIVQTQMPDLLNKIQESAVKINDSIILQGKQEEKSAVKAELSTSKVRLGEAQSSLKGTRDSLGRLFENVSIDIDGPLDKIRLGGEAEVRGFIGNIEDFVKQATKMGVISDGQGLDALARTGKVDLEDVWGNLDQGVRDGLTQSGGFGGRLTPTDGTDIRQVFQGLVKDQTGFGQKLNQIAMDISTIETIKPTVNELQQNLSDASAAVAQFKNDIARNRPIESSRGKASTQFGEATSKLRGAIKERDSVRAARGTFGGITQGLQRGDIRGAQSAVANLATGVQSGTISRGEMERQLTSIAQSTGADAGQLIRQVDAVTNSRQGPDRQQAGGRLASTLTGMARRGFSGGQSAQYFQGMGDREQGASAQISSKVSDLQSAASSFDAKLKQQFTKNYWNSPALNMLQPNKLTKADADKQSEIQPDWDTLVRLGKATKISAGFGKNAYVRQSAQVQGLIGGLLRNPTSAGLGNAEKLFGEIQNTSRLKSFQQAAVDYERNNKKYLFAGHVPNFEMGMAKSMGAGSDVKAHMGDGTIGGKRFMMNNYETEIARPGNDSFVIPSYAGGHVPNFAYGLHLSDRSQNNKQGRPKNREEKRKRIPKSRRGRTIPKTPEELAIELTKRVEGRPVMRQSASARRPYGSRLPAGSLDFDPTMDFAHGTVQSPRSGLDPIEVGSVGTGSRRAPMLNVHGGPINLVGERTSGDVFDLGRSNRQSLSWTPTNDAPLSISSRTQNEGGRVGQRVPNQRLNVVESKFAGGNIFEELKNLAGDGPSAKELNTSSLGYNDLMKKLGLRKGGGGGPDVAMEFLDDELMERLGRLNEMFPGENIGDNFLDRINKNLAPGVDPGEMIRTNDLIESVLGPQSMDKLDSMSTNIKNDKGLRTYLESILNPESKTFNPKKANDFLHGNEGQRALHKNARTYLAYLKNLDPKNFDVLDQEYWDAEYGDAVLKEKRLRPGYQVPDKHANKKPKKPIKQRFSDWLAEKKKGRADKASAKNQAKLNKAYGELGTDELAKLFMPPKKGAMDRLANFRPKAALDAFLPFAPPPSSRIGPWNEWVRTTRVSGGAKGPLRDLLTSFHAGKNPLNFANNVIKKRLPFDDFISEDVTEKKLAKAKKKASLGTDGKPPKETPKSSAIKDRIKAGLKRSGAVVDAIRNFGATPEGAIEEVLEEIAEPEMGGKHGQKGVTKPYDPTGGKTGPEGTPKGGAKDKANKKGKPGRTRAWLKNKAAPRLQGWHKKVSDLEGRWIKHTRSHPNQYKGVGSFHTKSDAKFRGARVMGKELGVGVLATMLINKVAGGNVPDYDRKLATSKYTGEFLGLGFKTSPDPVGVLDVLMDHFPGIGTGKMGAGDISGQGLLKDAVSMFLPPPASLVMMSLEEMHRQWFQTLDLVQRTKEDIHKSDNKGFKMFADSKIKTQKQGTSDITNLNLFKNQLASLNSVHPFTGGEKFPAGVRWNGMDKWPTSGGSHGLGQRVTGYLPALKKNAGLNNVASRQSQRQNFANKWIEAITIDKKKGIYRLDNEEASSFDFLNLNKYMGRTVQYGNINKLEMGKGGGFRYPKKEKQQIAYGGELVGGNLRRTPMDPISSRSKLSIRGKGRSARFDYKSPSNGGMFGLYPTKAARKKIGVSKSTTDKFKLMAKTFPYEELSKYFNRQGNANAAAGNAVPPAQRAPQMSELLTGGSIEMATSAWWAANGANALGGVGNAAPPFAGGAWDSKAIKQLMMNIPLTNAIPAVTWGNTGDALPIGLSNALNKPHWNNPPISNRDLGGLARYARAQYREHKDSEKSDWRRANNTARYQPKNDVDRGIANRKIKKQKNAASWMYKLALDQVKPNPRNRVGEYPAQVQNFLDPHHAVRPNLDPLLFNTLAGNAVSSKYIPLHDMINTPGSAFDQRRTAMSGNAAGTPIGYHMKELFNAGHNGFFDPVALLQMSRAHGIIDRVRTSSDATVSSRPSQGIKFPNAQDLVSGWGSATRNLREDQLRGNLFAKAPADFRKEAGGNNSELFQFFQNKGRFDKLVHFGGHVPSFANNLETLGAKMQGARNPKAMTGPGTINNKKYVANTEETIIPSKVFSQMGIPTKNGDDAVLRNYGSGATQDRKALASSIPNFAFSSYRNRVRGDHFGGIRGNTNTRTEGTRNYRGGDRLNNVKLFGTSMRDFAFSGMGASAQRDQNRRFRGGNNIGQADINTIISRTRETGNVNLGGFGGMYTPGYGNFDPKIEYSSGNPSGALKGHERFHAVFDQAEVDSFFGQSAMNFQSKDMAGSMKSRFDLSKLFDTGSAYNYGGNIRGGSLPDTLSGINEMLAYSMMGKGRAGADKFAEGKMDARLRGTALRGLTRFNDRDAVKGFGGAAKLAGGGDFFDGMMMFEELASKKYVNRGHIPNFNLVGSALARERSAMPSGSRAMTGFDPRLRGGIGVFNSSEGSLGDAIDMHRAAGKSMSQIQNAGSAGYNSGHIPNFAEGAIADSLSSLAQQQGAGGAGTGNFDGAEIVNLLSEMVNGIGGLSSVVSTGFETQVGAFTEGQQNVNIGGSLPVNVTLGGTVQDASAAIVGQLQTKVNAFMNKALTPAQQGEVNAMSRFGDRQG